MTVSFLIAFLPGLLGLSAATAHLDQEVRTLVVQEELIMRIPVRPERPAVQWSEKKGPQCVAHRAIRGARLTENGVDFLLQGGRRLRAELGEDCPDLDFYNGFYLVPDDDYVCAGRETVRSRTGGSCPITRFRRLVPTR